MIRAPHILLIGASGQNQGKSTLSCRIIERYAGTQPIVAAKITSIRKRNGECPRGGKGCGVCSSLEGDWALSEEVGDNPTKDTGRMLSAGAQQVFWLRVFHSHLDEGIRALLERVGDRPLVCEGNSPRLVMEPGTYVVSRHRATAEHKASAAAVQQHVDQTLFFDGTDYDPAPEHIALEGSRWTVKRTATAVILAGGHSRRMGRDKSLLELDGQPLIAHIADQLRPHFDEVLVSTNDAARYAFLNLPMVPDREPDQGPLMGITSALTAARHDRVFVTATDIPELDMALVASLLRRARTHDVVVPRYENGYLEPLYAVYRRRFAAAADAALAEGQRGVRAAFGRCEVTYLDLDAALEPANLNTPEDLARFQSTRRP